MVYRFTGSLFIDRDYSASAAKKLLHIGTALHIATGVGASRFFVFGKFTFKALGNGSYIGYIN
ncbi:hypothetical protein J2TS6_28210 [Paenibacillus albilobatus]|uniref:Uncharacterized protein n=1 Tax=Paenibacillus albilobatus TaxID=2716884 RepID=A0A919XIV5_9BACL|nr:hypothetical protein J2TS6_28210 [Paenibacillus albilobatus]